MPNEHLVCDTETNGLVNEVTKFHMLQVGTLDGNDVTIYADAAPDDEVSRARRGVVLGDVTLHLTCPIRPLREGIDRLKAAEKTYWHNGFGYDQHIMERFFPGSLRRDQIVDTLILARLLTREMNNSLEAWGQRLGCHKGKYAGDFQSIDAELLAYSQQDVAAGRALAQHLLKLSKGSERAIDCEMAVAYWIDKQVHTGFTLDEDGARNLHVDLQAKLRELEAELRVYFPPRWAKIGEKIPKTSSSKFGFSKGVPFTQIKWDEFSPGSRQMIALRLQEIGWKPKTFTPSGQPVVTEDTLKALAASRFPMGRPLAEYFDTSKQAAFVESWLKLCRNGRVHGRVNTLGAYTHRMTHSDPNMAQIPKQGPYRKLWKPRKGWKLIGCDGEGIQMRVLSHYTSHWDGGRFARILESGVKEDKTDIHSANAIACEKLFPTEMDFKHRRDTVKNCAYAILFNAGDPRLGQTLKDGVQGYAKLTPPKVPNRELGAAVRRGIEHNLVGLSECIALVEKTYEKRGYMVGLDGRKLYPNSKRNAFMTIIQGGEAVIMKHALVMFCDEIAPAKGWAYDKDWALVANIHDEAQIEARPEIAEEIGKSFAGCITEAGVRLGMKCAFAGSYDIGDNWSETH